MENISNNNINETEDNNAQFFVVLSIITAATKREKEKEKGKRMLKGSRKRDTNIPVDWVPRCQ